MVSNVLCDLAAGDLVDLSAPTGGFRLPEGDAPLVFITAGIGAAMLRSVNEHRSSSSRRASAPPCSAAWTSTAPSPSKGRAVPSGRPALLSFGHFLGVSLL